MEGIIMFIILCLLIASLLCPVGKELKSQEIVWSDDFEQDTVGGPAKGWIVSSGTWFVAFDSSKVYRCEGGSGVSRVAMPVVPRGYEIQFRLKVTQVHASTFEVRLNIDNTMIYWYGWDVFGETKLFITNTICNCPFVASSDFDLSTGIWYIFKVHLDIYGLASFKVWKSNEDEPDDWLLSTSLWGCREQGYLHLEVSNADVDFDDIQVSALATGVKLKSWGEIKNQYRLWNH